MQEVKITKADNGFVIQIISDGIQTLDDRREIFVAKDKEEVFAVLEEEAF